MTTLGIIGGLSPETTAELYSRLAEKSRERSNHYSHIIIDSIPLDFSIEDEMIIHGKNQHRLLPFLLSSLKRLQNTDLIVIPCNTAHIFIGDLRKQSCVPVISIVEETEKELKRRVCRKVGMLATMSTAQSGVYEHTGIEFVYPPPHDQKELGEIIVRAIRNNATEQDKTKLQRIADNLLKECETLVLACTELQRVLKGDYVDSFEILAEAVFERIGGVKSANQ